MSRERNEPAHKPILLLVDDDVVVQSAIARMLRVDFEVLCANDAQAAMALLIAHGPFDALVTDLDMPGCNGFELLERVAAVDARLARRAVVCTGAPLTDVEQGELGQHGYVIVLKARLRRADLIAAIRAQIATHP